MPHARCECQDPGCPVCKGKCQDPVDETLYRIDMKDKYGTRMCEGCALDAYGTGLYR